MTQKNSNSTFFLHQTIKISFQRKLLPHPNTMTIEYVKLFYIILQPIWLWNAYYAWPTSEAPNLKIVHWLQHSLFIHMLFYTSTITHGFIATYSTIELTETWRARILNAYSTYMVLVSCYLGIIGFFGLIGFFTMKPTENTLFWYACWVTVTMVNISGMALWIVIMFALSLLMALLILGLWKCGCIDASSINIDGSSFLSILENMGGSPRETMSKED
jgi:hypothetical protein